MFEIVTLPNGVRVALETMPFVRSAAVGVWVESGSRHETPETNGISHFIEHMLFKGTARRTAKDIADEMDAVGGQLNAYTTKECTCYHARVLDTHLEKAVDVLSDMFFHSAFAPAEIERERGVILEEIAMYEDTPEDIAHDGLQAAAWRGSALGMPIQGTAASIAPFTQETFRAYMSAHYRPERTVLSVAGNFDRDKTLALLEKAFGNFPTTADAPAAPALTVYSPGAAAEAKDVEQLHLCLGFPGISVDSEESYTLAVMNAYLGGGMSSRLFQSLREDSGLVYSIYSSHEAFRGAGLFTIYAALNPQQAKAALALIHAEIVGLLNGGITAEELERKKEQLKSSYLLSLESSGGRMGSIGRSTLLLNRILSPDELIARIDRVDLPGVLDLAKRIFRLDQLSLSAAGGTKGIDAKELITYVQSL